MLKEVKKYVSELLLGWAFSIRPDGRFKENLRQFIIDNYNPDDV